MLITLYKYKLCFSSSSYHWLDQQFSNYESWPTSGSQQMFWWIAELLRFLTKLYLLFHHLKKYKTANNILENIHSKVWKKRSELDFYQISISLSIFNFCSLSQSGSLSLCNIVYFCNRWWKLISNESRICWILLNWECMAYMLGPTQLKRHNQFLFLKKFEMFFKW